MRGHGRVDTYGKRLPLGKKSAVDALDDERGRNVVVKTATGTPAVAEVPVLMVVRHGLEPLTR
ncbi:MAG: hypothetical protein ACREKS_20475 [Candidatus Rokuibacteriota bacterium]